MASPCAFNNATFRGSAYLGVGLSTLATTTWDMCVNNSCHFNVAIVLVDTQKQCLPVNEFTVGVLKGYSIIQITSFYNTLGIKDPGVFTPPESSTRICHCHGDAVSDATYC